MATGPFVDGPVQQQGELRDGQDRLRDLRDES
jgi:hypothetical protein